MPLPPLRGDRCAVPDRSPSGLLRLLIGSPPIGRSIRNAIIYHAEYAFLTKRLDTIGRTLAWLEAKGRRFTRTARELVQEQSDLARRLMHVEDLTEYDTID